MIPRRIIAVLVYALPLCLVACSVMTGAMVLAQSTQDQAAARVLKWIAATALLLGVIDMTLLVGALGLNAVADNRDDSDASSGGSQPGA